MHLPPGWYVIGRPEELSPRKPNAVKRFGQDFVVWKSASGNWVAQSDICPHRSAKLSQGKLRGDCIACPFHGFEFDSKGDCTLVPELGTRSPGLKVKSTGLAVAHGFLWMPWKDPKTPIPWFDELNAPFTFSHSAHRWNTHFSRCVENQLDYAHLPYVHANTIGAGFDPKVNAQFHLDGTALRVNIGGKKSPEGYFEFRFPNIWLLNISSKMKEFAAFVPVSENETRIYIRNYHAFTRIPVLRETIAWLSSPFNSYILNQDKAVVLPQEPRNTLKADSEILMGSDRAVIAFRKWMAAVGNG